MSYEANSDSLELWSPGNSLFLAPEFVAEAGTPLNAVARRAAEARLRRRGLDAVGLLQGYERPHLAIGDLVAWHPCALRMAKSPSMVSDRPQSPRGPLRRGATFLSCLSCRNDRPSVTCSSDSESAPGGKWRTRSFSAMAPQACQSILLLEHSARL